VHVGHLILSFPIILALLEIANLSEDRGCVRIRSLVSSGSWLLPVFRHETNANFRAVDPDQFASPERQSGGRQEQEKFLSPQLFQRALDFQSGAGRRDVEKNTAASPGAVDTHEIDGALVFETNAVGLSISKSH
jgi:hypothetical protein